MWRRNLLTVFVHWLFRFLLDTMLVGCSKLEHPCWVPGGSLSIDWFLWPKMSLIVSLSELRGLILTVRMTVIVQSYRKLSASEKGWPARYTDVSVTSLCACQACQTDFLYLPLKAVVSQPENAWNAGDARGCCSPGFNKLRWSGKTDNSWSCQRWLRCRPNVESQPDHGICQQG